MQGSDRILLINSLGTRVILHGDCPLLSLAVITGSTVIANLLSLRLDVLAQLCSSMRPDISLPYAGSRCYRDMSLLLRNYASFRDCRNEG
jgi:hypothetical protein